MAQEFKSCSKILSNFLETNIEVFKKMNLKTTLGDYTLVVEKDKDNYIEFWNNKGNDYVTVQVFRGENLVSFIYSSMEEKMYDLVIELAKTEGTGGELC